MAKILIVDDSPDILGVLRELLSVEHEVITARRGEEAITQAKLLHPDLVILDVQLPGMSGIEAGIWIKKENAPKHIPILALTGLSGADEAKAIINSGCCDDYLSKPASLADIRSKVSKLLQQRQAA